MAALLLPLARHSDAQSVTAAREEVEHVNREFIAAFKAGNAAAAAAVMTANGAIVEEDGTRLDGRAAIAAAFKELLSSLRVPAMSITISTFGASGGTAWAAGTETGSFVDRKTRASTPIAVQYLCIYERQPDGKFLFRYWLETKMPPKAGK